MNISSILKNKDTNIVNEILILIGFIGIGTIGRTLLVGGGLQPFPNFEIIMVTTFLAIFFIRPSLAIFVPLFSMIFSDLLVGNTIFIGSEMNRIVLFTYSGFAMVALINILNKNRFRKGLVEMKLKNIGFAAGLGIGFVLIYDVWTNFGWWYIISPTHSVESLVAVYSAGVPFMIYHILSGVFTFVTIALPVISFTSIDKRIESSVKTKRIHKIPVFVVVIGLVLLSFTGTALQIPEKSEIWLEESDETSVKMVIIGDGWTLEDNIFAYNDDTVFSILQRFAQRNSIDLKYTFYESFDSYLIDEINGVVNGDQGMYWQYYVNDDIPMVGCNNFEIKNGDYVEWVFESVPY